MHRCRQMHNALVHSNLHSLISKHLFCTAVPSNLDEQKHVPSYTQKLDHKRVGRLLIAVERKKHSSLITTPNKKKNCDASKLCVKIKMELYCVAFKK